MKYQDVQRVINSELLNSEGNINNISETLLLWTLINKKYKYVIRHMSIYRKAIKTCCGYRRVLFWFGWTLILQTQHI